MNGKMGTPRSILGLMLVSLIATVQFAAAQEKPPQKPAKVDAVKLIDVQRGELPIIISAPHGGHLSIADVAARKGQALPAKASKFVVLQDYGTADVARRLAAELEMRFGRKPYLVVSRAHRRYLDPNRPSREAFEDPRVAKVYERYHGALDEFCREVSEQHQSGLLIDLHGQGLAADKVFRGTQNGRTVSLLQQRFGEDAHTGDKSLFGLLKARGWTVHPQPFDQQEQPGYNGGYIVRTYGSHQSYATDSIQIELGRQYREVGARRKTASQLADAVHDYSVRYLKQSSPTTSNREAHPSDADSIQVAVFSGKGTGPSRKNLLAALKLDSRLTVRQLDEFDIRSGKLTGCDVLVHPGGSGGGQGRALGKEGRAIVREFVENGGGYLGICAGAYLATCDYTWSLNILDARVVDRAHWARGFGTVALGLSATGRKHLGVSKSELDIYYHQGPLLAPAENPDIEDYSEWGTFRGDVVKEGVPNGVMPGTTAIAAASHVAGRVVCFSPHPEKTAGQSRLVVVAIRWLAAE
jgi:N-formylglutamate amidohydrolase/putative intracellular protease/amidase